MKKILTILLVLGIAYHGVGQQLAAARIDTLLQVYTTLHKFNGTVLVAKGGNIVLEKGYGYRQVANGIPHDKTSVFQIGSITKQFTTAIIVKLQAEGKLNVQDRINKYFPDFPRGDSITIEQLMLHTSGIYNYTNDRTWMQTEVTKPTNREKMIATFKNKPADFSPGAGWNYSNSAYLLLGYIIESVTKKPYTTVVRDYIFKPLQMNNSGFDFTHLQRREKSIGYFAFNEKDTLPSPIVDSSVSFAAGAIYSTTGDLYRWHQALQHNTILTKEQQAKAYTPVKNKYGYGWIIDSLYGKQVVTHGGGIHGFTSDLLRIPSDDVCIILLSNNSSPVLHDIATSIAAILYEKPYETPKVRKAITLPEDKLKQYVGEYVIRENLHVVITLENGKLLATPTNQRTNELFAETADQFFDPNADVLIRFTRNEKQEVDGFIFRQRDTELKCPKIK